MKTKIIFIIILTILTAIAIFVACETKPIKPFYDNPYDPQNDVADDIPPIINLYVTPDSGIVNETLFKFDATGSYENDNPEMNLQFRWDIGNDGFFENNWSTNPVFSDTIHNYSGELGVKLEVKGMKGLIADTIFIIYVDYFEWITISAGEYTYGAQDSVKIISNDFQIMKYEVTNQQYITYIEEALSNGKIVIISNVIEGYYSGDQYWSAGNYTFFNLNSGRIGHSNSIFYIQNGYENHPVVEVTWFGAADFAKHYGYRLPTEFEWEKAARGNTGWDYPWGDNIDGNRANYWNSGDPFETGDYPWTTPVGFYNGQNYQGFQTNDSQSSFGAYDMAGNVWEWCDSFGDSSNPSIRVFRGGSWDWGTFQSNSWIRNISQLPTHNDISIGFRCGRN